MAELLSLRGVGKGYRRGGRWLRVLVDVSLEVDRGELVAVVAARGEGKTTLLKIAAGLELPDAGEVCVGKIDLARCSDEERSRQLGGEIAWVHRGGTGVKFEVSTTLACRWRWVAAAGGATRRCLQWRRSSGSAPSTALISAGRSSPTGSACWSGLRAAWSASRA